MASYRYVVADVFTDVPFAREFRGESDLHAGME